MCGRFALYAEPALLKMQFGLEPPPIVPHYNIAPGQDILVLYAHGNAWQLTFMRWGFVPFFARDNQAFKPLANARAETAAEKTVFRHAFQKKRALILMSGFFEWQAYPDHKQPFYMTPKTHELLAVAGLYDVLPDREGGTTARCCLLTTEALPALTAIHHRMPVMLNQEGIAAWLDLTTPLAEVSALLSNHQTPMLDVYPVTAAMNSARYDSIAAIKPLEDGQR